MELQVATITTTHLSESYPGESTGYLPADATNFSGGGTVIVGADSVTRGL